MIENVTMVIGKNIRKARHNGDYTQEQVAEKMGMNRNHYGRIERGVTLPSIERLLEISRILSTPVEQFFSGTYSIMNFDKPPDDYMLLMVNLMQGRSVNQQRILLQICEAVVGFDSP